MIEVVCICKWRFKVQDEHAGLAIKCPKCRRLVDVPTAPPPLSAEADVPPGPEAEQQEELVERPAPPGVVAADDLQTLHASIERLVAVNRSINLRLAWIVGLLVLILIRILLYG